MVANPLFLRDDGRLAPFAGHCFVFVALVTFRKKKKEEEGGGEESRNEQLSSAPSHQRL